MIRASLSLLLGMALVLTAGAATAEAGKGTKKNGEHWVTGRVVAIHPQQNSLALTVQTHHHRKAGVAGRTGTTHHSHHTFHLHKGTAVEMVRAGQRTPAGMSAIQRGAHVGVLAHGHDADRVEILAPSHHPARRPGRPRI